MKNSLKQKAIAFLFFLILSNTGFGQIVYVDMLTPQIVAGAEATLRSQQEETNQRLGAIRETQALINAQMARLNNIQTKVRKGLTEVNGTLQNGLSVRNIARTTVDIYGNVADIGDIVAESPEFAPFAVDQVDEVYLTTVAIYAESAAMMASDDFNWMTAGDRQRLIMDIYWKLRKLKTLTYSIKYKLLYAKRTGFLRMLNPFRTWANRDVQIMQSVMDRYNRLII